jgi:hypothetical protein|tara:strand:+ start:247 stop:486 length:240 start_codon:yes stop_codon:yes gene_type:complete
MITTKKLQNVCGNITGRDRNNYRPWTDKSKIEKYKYRRLASMYGKKIGSVEITGHITIAKNVGNIDKLLEKSAKIILHF